MIQRIFLLFIIPFFITLLYSFIFFKRKLRILFILFFIIIALLKVSVSFNKQLYEYKNILFEKECIECRKRIRELHYLER